MSFQVKSVIISFAIALAGSLLINVAGSRPSGEDFFLAFGFIGVFGGLLEVVVGLCLLFAQDKKYAQGLLISGGLLMVIGFATCTAGISGMSFR